MIDRKKQILEQLTLENKIEVAILAQRLGVSPVTMRKDLDALEKIGLIVREHGFAAIGSRENLNNRMAYHYEEKQRIARLAAESVQPGETVMIESGSCCALLAAALCKNKKDVTIITNSAFIADYVRGQKNSRVILLGGAYQNESQVMVGPLTALCAESFFVDKLFVGADGFMQSYGFMGTDMLRVETVCAMKSRAEKLNILTDSSKFTKRGVVNLMPFSDIDRVYTDCDIPDAAKDILIGHDVEVLTTS